jgi:multisubunit Na+/H+ antiporter MnhE subunit
MGSIGSMMKIFRKTAGVILIIFGGWIIISNIISSGGSFVGIAIGAIVVYGGLFVFGANKYLRRIFGIKEKTGEEDSK